MSCTVSRKGTALQQNGRRTCSRKVVGGFYLTCSESVLAANTVSSTAATKFLHVPPGTPNQPCLARSKRKKEEGRAAPPTTTATYSRLSDMSSRPEPRGRVRWQCSRRIHALWSLTRTAFVSRGDRVIQSMFATFGLVANSLRQWAHRGNDRNERQRHCGRHRGNAAKGKKKDTERTRKGKKG